DHRCRGRGKRDRPLARPRHARAVQAARRVARRNLREYLRARRRRVEDQVAAALRELRRPLRARVGAARAGRRARAERGLEGVSARPYAEQHAGAVPRSAAPAVPGAQPGHRPAGEGSELMRKVTLSLALALALVPLAASAQPSPEARLAAYRERVERLEDADAIENLQATYGYHFDKGLWNEAADLFAADGTFEYGQMGVYVGRERIRRAMLLFGPEGLGRGYLNNHMLLQPIITVAPEGRTATARWQGMVMLSEPGANGVWGIGQYENA